MFYVLSINRVVVIWCEKQQPRCSFVCVSRKGLCCGGIPSHDRNRWLHFKEPLAFDSKRISHTRRCDLPRKSWSKRGSRRLFGFLGGKKSWKCVMPGRTPRRNECAPRTRSGLDKKETVGSRRVGASHHLASLFYESKYSSSSSLGSWRRVGGGLSWLASKELYK